jgi:hypothetical protein
LEDVAELAAKFADAFGAREWGRLAGLWNDLPGLSRREWRSVARNHAQLRAALVKPNQKLGMEPVHPGSDLYVWNNLYDPLLLGVMQGILPLVFANHGKELIVDNIS